MLVNRLSEQTDRLGLPGKPRLLQGVVDGEGGDVGPVLEEGEERGEFAVQGGDVEGAHAVGVKGGVGGTNVEELGDEVVVAATCWRVGTWEGKGGVNGSARGGGVKGDNEVEQ